MIPAVFILILAWSLTDLIEVLETGLYLSDVVMKANFPVAFLPVIMFILACLMAFSTGTSWGSFTILLPIAGKIMIDAAPEMLLPALAGSTCWSGFRRPLFTDIRYNNPFFDRGRM